jgi:hypothetical protein
MYMTGCILKKNRARQKARNVNIVDCSIILVNVAEIPMKKKPCPAKGKKCEYCGLFNNFSKCCRNSNAGSSSKQEHTRQVNDQDRAQLTSLHGQSVHQDRMTGHSPT